MLTQVATCNYSYLGVIIMLEIFPNYMPDATCYAHNYAGKIDSSLTTSSIWKPLHTTL